MKYLVACIFTVLIFTLTAELLHNYVLSDIDYNNYAKPTEVKQEMNSVENPCLELNDCDTDNKDTSVTL
ncbi:hypothetical protein L1267_10900 [Pseudoalteromonas sp. OFAV1]|uniref:hypothetical protein n=1 Tax=Pseudoalteromonas sp. OFAV1 TaxID=2908892 RepID=UPI001F464143|nr:hypothetical protein [Pseudoalteromonas sp. OFAV1]MCF2900911.1 hypothetical protein [Pseudoalteromonas sp. OFAV1]